ncbi:hypothetical protein L484_024710 [Morus notabilis]|uniref:Uncharacterized protein n=1 Tax=Morus notabilis TaxID=981085 RepID=W9RT86_9ROSA|nr:hypothetical protein L484_024710 [Morus notabilis]
MVQEAVQTLTAETLPQICGEVNWLHEMGGLRTQVGEMQGTIRKVQGSIYWFEALLEQWGPPPRAGVGRDAEGKLIWVTRRPKAGGATAGNCNDQRPGGNPRHDEVGDVDQNAQIREGPHREG